MLTIKHIDTDGTETLIEAERIDVVRHRGIGEDGIFLDRVPGAFRHVIHFAHCRATGDHAPRVYVMNRYGSTVATYDL